MWRHCHWSHEYEILQQFLKCSADRAGHWFSISQVAVARKLSWELRCPKVPCSMLVLITVCLELWPRRTDDWLKPTEITMKLKIMVWHPNCLLTSHESPDCRILHSPFSLLLPSLYILTNPVSRILIHTSGSTTLGRLRKLGLRAYLEDLVHTYIKDVWSATASCGVLAVWLI